MGYSYGGDSLQVLQTGATATYTTVGCDSAQACYNQVADPSYWTCVTDKCNYRGVPLRNWVGTCDASSCGSGLMINALTCEPLQTCRMGSLLGGGELPFSKCSSSWDCTSADYLKDAMFKCDTGNTQTGGNQAGGSGKCMFAYDYTVPANFARIADFPVNWCIQDSDCVVDYVREGRNCGGPRFGVAVRGLHVPLLSVTPHSNLASLLRNLGTEIRPSFQRRCPVWHDKVLSPACVQPSVPNRCLSRQSHQDICYPVYIRRTANE